MRATLLLSILLITSWSFSFATDCVDPPATVDVESEAYSTVIVNDPFCCNNVWDGICQNAYDNFNGDPGNPGDSGDCVQAPAEVDTESDAYATVIANDPFCCNTNWDGICQNAYNNIEGSGGGGEDEEEGQCVNAPASVDMDSEAYTTVIANDPFCCNYSWDGICQNAYDAIVGSGSDPGDDDGEEGPDCVGPPDSVDTSSDAYATLIANDPFCCNYWDNVCQVQYDAYSGSGGSDDPDDCVADIPTSVDVNSDAFEQVITSDPFCCNNVWDGICQNAYNNLVGLDDEDEEGDSDCVGAPESVDMDSEAYATVIANDPFCCNNMWDGICQNAYNGLVNDNDEEGPDCVGPPDSVDTSSDAYATLIANDPFCCNYWDNVCQIQYDAYSGSGGSGDPGDCVADIPASVDVNSDAFEQVIANDPFCCNNVWDNICQNAYDDYSEGGIIVNPEGGISGLPDEPFDFSLFPNPASNNVFLQFKSVNTELPVFVRVHNSLGQVVIEKGNIQVEQMNQLSMDVSGLSGGIYLLTAINGEQMMSRQLVVK